MARNGRRGATRAIEVAARAGGRTFSSFDPDTGAAVLHVETDSREDLRISITDRTTAERIEVASRALATHLREGR